MENSVNIWNLLWLSSQLTILDEPKKHYSGYQSHAPSNVFFLFQKLRFGGRQIICIHDNNGEQSFQNHYFNVNSQSIRAALSS